VISQYFGLEKLKDRLTKTQRQNQQLAPRRRSYKNHGKSRGAPIKAAALRQKLRRSDKSRGAPTKTATLLQKPQRRATTPIPVGAAPRRDAGRQQQEPTKAA